jgi:hypothetical protein
MSVFAILASTVIGIVLGVLWYSPLLFGPAWMRCIGKTPGTLGNQTASMIGSVLASLMMAVGVSFLYAMVGSQSIFAATHIGLILAVLVIFPTILSDNLFCGWGRTLLLIQSAYRMLAVILMSIATYFLQA